MTTENVSVPGGKSSKPICRYITIGLRTLMGLLFVMTGSNGFLNFLPQPKTPMPEAAMAFIGALVKTGYMMPLIMGTQLLVGVLLVTGCFVPLALALIAPIIVGIVTFHLFLAPSGAGMGIFVLVVELYLAWAYRAAFRPMLGFRTKPGC
jgi:uncharacterized membrane protein YphA (DoxX/SURF4 family)